MSIPRIKTLVYLLVGCLCLAMVLPAVAQETTGGIQGVVKDPTGAVIAKATVEVISPAMIGKKVLETDASGYYRFANLPPGDYTLTATAAGFRPFRQTGIGLQVGHLPTLDITLVVGTTQEVVEVTGEGAIVDVTQSKVQTNISQDILANVPKGRSFQSVIQFAPGARTEPLQSANLRDNGFQIGGASNSENAYLVEGQETASPFDGISKANVPMEFIQEVQVKTNGFEAEFGGALGGVVNVIQKRGGNEWHGDAFFIYAGDAFNAAPNLTLRRDPQVGTNAGGAKRLDQPAQYYQPKKDPLRVITPGFDLSGPIFRDRLWMFASFAPQLTRQSRTVNFGPTAAVPGQRTFFYNDNIYYANGRLDWLATQKIRLFGSWTYQYERQQGRTFPTADSPYSQYNPDSTQNVDNYNYGLGLAIPNSIYNFGADITLNSSTVATTRLGLFKFDNGQSRGLPIGIMYWNRDTNYPYTTSIASSMNVKGLDGTTLPTAYQHDTNWSNIGNNNGTTFDAWKNWNFNQDLAYFHKGWGGTHNFKVGYGFRKGENNIMSGYNTAQVYLAYATEYFPGTTGGVNNCNAIIGQNQTRYGKPGGTLDSSCQGLYGTVNIRDLATTGKVGGWNHSIYFQDAWTVGNRLTLNLGLRMDKEDLPSYIKETGFNGISFGWDQKLAPRLGASYDLTGNGKVKVYGSFGYFYDIMKYQMPRGSFGGDYWHDCVYALDNPNYNLILPARDAKGHYCPLGGQVQAVGSYPAAGLRFIENLDYRQPANDPTSFGSLGKTGLIDPNLKPMQQHELVFGSDWAINPKLAFEAIYSRKRLDRTIEDVGVGTPNGEQYYIMNPGLSIDKVVPSFECTGCPPNPKAIRDYDGIEFRLTRKGTSNINGSLSYTYSRLYGNYTGLTATDVSDGGAGRNGANSDRAFDEPFMQFDAHGRVINGPLATDRPHTFKAYGYYNLKWNGRMNSMIGIYDQIYSGTPLSSYTSVNPGGAPVFIEGRGKFVNLTRDPATGNFVAGSVVSKRTPIFANTDFNFIHEFHVSKVNERLIARFEANIANVFNQKSPVLINQNMVRTGSISPASCSKVGGCPPTNQSGGNYAVLEKQGYDYIGSLNSGALTLNSLYGMPYGWQQGRNMRFKLAFSF